jgi:hypothetical protein
MDGAQRGQTFVASFSWRTPALKYLPRLVSRPAIHVQDGHTLADKILAQAFLNGLRGLPDGRGVVVRRNADQQIDLADAHELAKKIVCEETLFSQVPGAP